MRGLSLYKVYPFSPFTSINEEHAGNSYYWTDCTEPVECVVMYFVC
jgi:hypothetical protein